MAILDLVRDTTRFDPARQVKELVGLHRAEREKLDKIRMWWKGLQDLAAVIPSTAPREVREMAVRSPGSINVCDIIVESLAQSVLVTGFRAGRDETNAAPWGVWQANRQDRGQTALHRATFAYGTSYETVLPGVDADGNETAVIRHVPPRRMLTVYGEDPDWPIWALERWDKDTFRLYDEANVYHVGRNNRSEFVLASTDEHGLGVTPVVRYRDTWDDDLDDDIDEAKDEVVIGQVWPMVKLQSQIDMTTFALLVAQHYSSFKQRAIMGWVPENETEKLKAAASRIWTFKDHPDDLGFFEFSETNLDGYIGSREAALKYAATLSQTPVHELIGELVNLSAEALAAVEAGRDRKIDERHVVLGESHEQKFWLVGRITGIEVPSDAEVRWKDTSARSFAAVVDGLGKLAEMLGVPAQGLWEMIPDVTDQQLERWRALAEAGTPLSFFTDMLERQADQTVGV